MATLERTLSLFAPELLHAQLTLLLDEKPDLVSAGPLSADAQKWLGRAVALVEVGGDKTAAIQIAAVAKVFPEDPLIRRMSEQQVVAALHIAVARAELRLPASVRGSFIAAGSGHDAYAAVAKILASATADVLLIDAYASDKILEYALAAPEKISVRVLGDKADHKPSLKPAAQAWAAQYAAVRPLEVRLAPPKSLHDRLILVDGKTAWGVGQSFNALAARAHTSISHLEPEIEARKIAAYAAIWSGSGPI